MALFTYKGEVEMVYVDFTDVATGGTLYAVPGETYELESNPDSTVFVSKKAAKVVDDSQE